MISISKPLTTAKVASYYREEYTATSQTYYSQHGQLRGEWHGKLAAEFGLSGAVDELMFHRLANGQDPQSAEQLISHRDTIKTKTGQEIGHRAGWDLTFSPPKSVSQTALVGGDERVRQAHREAVRVSLDSTEKYVQARLGGDRPAVTTGKWVTALFEHDSARPVDGYAAPQLHTHVVLFNMTSLDKARSIDPKEIYRVQSMSTAIYRAELAARLVSFGYELEHQKGHSFEVKGYSKDYLEADSARRQEIIKRMDELGVSGAENAERVSHQTRDRKLRLTAEHTRSMHREMAKTFGDQPAQVVAIARDRSGIPDMDMEELSRTAHRAITFAKHRLIERSAIFDEYEVVRDALRYGLGTTRFRDVEQAFQQRQAVGKEEFRHVHHYREHAPGARYTTGEMIRLERETIRIAREGIGASKPLASLATKSILNDGSASLNSDQRALVANILQSPDRILAVQGGAGTGKTTAVAAIREVVETIGFETRGLAPTSRAASELRDVGLQTETIQRHLARRSIGRTDSATVYFLDESSLASTSQMHAFLSELRHEDRVVLIGDTRQHQSVEAGRIFKQLQEAGMTTYRLDCIVRQKNEDLRKVVAELAQGNVPKAVQLLEQQGRIHEYANRQSRMTAIATAYAELPADSLVVSPDNASRRELNEAIRKELRTRGAIGNDSATVQTLQSRQDMTAADRVVATSYNEGDVIRYQRANRTVGVEKGAYGTVLDADGQTNTLRVQLADGRMVRYSPDRAFGVQVYQAESRAFAVGDRIQFTNPWNEQRIANRDTAVITALDPNGGITVRLADRTERSVSWNLRQMAHIDYAYAMTSYSAQGTTVDRVLIQVDSGDSKTRHLVDRSLAYVAASRSRHELELFTDDKTRLVPTLSRESVKSTALSHEQTVEYAQISNM